MHFSLPLLVISLSVGFNNATGKADRDCDSDPSNLWLDVVIVVDNSKNMTKPNLDLVFANIVECFGQGTRIGTNYDDPRTTRVGLVTYNQDATVVADLNKFQSFQDLQDAIMSAFSNVASTDQSFMQKGLIAAEQLLTSGRSNNYRSNYKKLVIVYAATYQGAGDLDPLPVATRLKTNGASISMVSMIKSSSSVNSYFSRIASSNMFFRLNYDTAYFLMNAAFQVNCYCRDTWIRYESWLPGALTHTYAVCVKAINQTTSWQVAKISCQDTVTNGYLVTDFSTEKHQFLQNVMMQLTAGYSTPGFHIGLTYVNGMWLWQQPNGQTISQYDAINTSPPLFWNTGYPNLPTVNTGVMSTFVIAQYFWENVNIHTSIQNYICEVDACDTKTYCP